MVPMRACRAAGSRPTCAIPRLISGRSRSMTTTSPSPADSSSATTSRPLHRSCSASKAASTSRRTTRWRACTGPASSASIPQWWIDLTTRAGYLLNPITLAYVRGGYTNARIETSVTDGTTLAVGNPEPEWLAGRCRGRAAIPAKHLGAARISLLRPERRRRQLRPPPHPGGHCLSLLTSVAGTAGGPSRRRAPAFIDFDPPRKQNYATLHPVPPALVIVPFAQ